MSHRYREKGQAKDVRALVDRDLARAGHGQDGGGSPRSLPRLDLRLVRAQRRGLAAAQALAEALAAVGAALPVALERRVVAPHELGPALLAVEPVLLEMGLDPLAREFGVGGHVLHDGRGAGVLEPNIKDGRDEVAVELFGR